MECIRLNEDQRVSDAFRKCLMVDGCQLDLYHISSVKKAWSQLCHVLGNQWL